MEEPDKKYLYHMVPDDMKSNEEGRQVLYPLNMLKEKFPGLYKIEIEKYAGTDNKRKTIPERIIPTLENAAWGDVIHLTAIHPEDLKKALVEAGFQPREFKFYQIDPDSLDPEQTTIYLYKDDEEKESPESFTEYNPKKLQKHSVVPEATKKYYQGEVDKGKKKAFLFVRIPHIFHKGPIDVSNFPVIAV